MDEPMPPEGDPFGGIPFLGDLFKMFQGGPGPGPDTARQLARQLANDGQTETNVDPIDRIAIEELVRVAELQVSKATGLTIEHDGHPLTVEAGNRSQWVDRTVTDYGPLFDALSSALVKGLPGPDDVPDDDPLSAIMGSLGQLMGPMMLGMTTGSMIGQMGRRAFGGYEIPVPRPPGGPILIVVPNLDAFGSDWSLPVDELRLWMCLHEVISHAVMGVPHIYERLINLLTRHAGAFEQNMQGLEEQFGGFDLDAGPEGLARLQESLSDPDAILGAMRSPEQDALQPEITALIAAITGYVDYIMDQIGTGLIGSYSMITEALHRRRVEANESDRFVERILGLELDQAQYDRGTKFAEGVVERAGAEGLARLLESPSNLPTPTEIDAPGLWLARIDLDDPLESDPS